MKWYASGGDIAQAGPFASEREAREAFRLTEEARVEQRRERGTASPYPWDLVVWPDDAKKAHPSHKFRPFTYRSTGRTMAICECGAFTDERAVNEKAAAACSNPSKGAQSSPEPTTQGDRR